MERIARYVIIVALLLLSIFSCRKETGISIDSDKEFLVLDATAADTVVKLTITGECRVYTSAVWCSAILPTVSSKTTRLIVHCEFNHSTEDRHCFITLEGDGSKKSIEVIQRGQSLLEIVEDKTVRISNSDTTIRVRIKASVVDYERELNVNILEGDDWLAYVRDSTNTRAQLSHEIVFKAKAQNDTTIRTAHIEISTASGLKDTLTIEQAEAYGLFLTNGDANNTLDTTVSYKLQTLEIQLRTNGELSFNSNATWITNINLSLTRTPITAKTLYMYLSRNKEYSDRCDSVTVAISDGQKDQAATIIIRQKGTPLLNVSPTEVSCPCLQDTIVSIIVNHNYDYSVEIPESDRNWIALDENLQKEKAGKVIVDTLTFRISKNQTLQERESVIRLGSVIDKDSLQTLIKIRQEVSESNFEDFSATGTANCYIVSKAGAYKFKLAKGNASYYFGNPLSVEVLWESFGTDVAPAVGDVISNVSIVNNYIRFVSGKDGNAVIAVKDSQGNTLWSWHRWVCEGFNPAATQQEYNNNAGIMMDRNLCATSITPGDVQALGLLYQWGRKDPFLGAKSKDGANTQAVSTINWPSVVCSDASNGTVGFATSHPTTFITGNTYNSDWYFTGKSEADDTRLQIGKNEIYDPCPVGWRVPVGGSNGVWSTAFGTSCNWELLSNWDNYNRGMNYENTDRTLGPGAIWYPVAAYRKNSDGEMEFISSCGRYWSATPCAYDAYCSSYKSNGYKCCYGMPIRPVIGR